MHAYPILLQGSTLEVFDGSGHMVSEIEAATGAVLSFEVDGKELVCRDKGIRMPISHMARNSGSTTFREVLVEKKR